MSRLWYNCDGTAAHIFLRVTPKSGLDKIGEVQQGPDDKAYLCVRVRAVAEGGKANKAAIKLLAKCLKVPPSRFCLVSGATSRYKHLSVAEPDATLAAALFELGGG